MTINLSDYLKITLSVGDIIKVNGYVKKYQTGNQTSLVTRPFSEDKEVLILGKSKRFTGTQHWEYEGPGYLEVAETHNVWIVMEIDKNNRYREPFAVLEEQMILE